MMWFLGGLALGILVFVWSLGRISALSDKEEM